MSHSEFKDLILPTIQKSLLRSPENVIESRFLLSRWVGGEAVPGQLCWQQSRTLGCVRCVHCYLVRTADITRNSFQIC